VGAQVFEIEGPDAERAVNAISASARVEMSVRTERGWRIGVSSAHAALATVVGAAPRLTRVNVRNATLEDVYFARTQGVSTAMPEATPAGPRT
jgi:hypothetical protein